MLREWRARRRAGAGAERWELRSERERAVRAEAHAFELVGELAVLRDRHAANVAAARLAGVADEQRRSLRREMASDLAPTFTFTSTPILDDGEPNR